jgi:hypothetical protein
LFPLALAANNQNIKYIIVIAYLWLFMII